MCSILRTDASNKPSGSALPKKPTNNPRYTQNCRKRKAISRSYLGLVDDRPFFYLTFSILIFVPTDPAASAIIFQLIHLPLGVYSYPPPVPRAPTTAPPQNEKLQ